MGRDDISLARGTCWAQPRARNRVCAQEILVEWMQESQTCSSFHVMPRHQGRQCFLAQKVPPASQPHLTSWWAAKPPRAPRSSAWAGPQQPVTCRVVGQRLRQVGKLPTTPQRGSEETATHQCVCRRGGLWPRDQHTKEGRREKNRDQRDAGK